MSELVNLGSVLEAVDLGGMGRAIKDEVQKIESTPDGLWLHFGEISIKIDVPKGKSPTLRVSPRTLSREVFYTAVKLKDGWKNFATEKWRARDDLEIPSSQAPALQQLEQQWSNYGGVSLISRVGYAEGWSSGQVNSVSIEIVPADLRLAVQYGILGQASVKEAANSQLGDLLKQMGFDGTSPDWTAGLLPGKMWGYPQINDLCQHILQEPGNTEQIRNSHQAAVQSVLGINLSSPFNPREYITRLLK